MSFQGDEAVSCYQQECMVVNNFMIHSLAVHINMKTD